MAFRFRENVPAPEEAKRIAWQQIAGALRAIDLPDPNKAVHEVRVRCKRIRALLCLLRPACPGLFESENRRFREISAAFAPARDSATRLAMFDNLVARARAAHDPVVRALREQLQADLERLRPADFAVHRAALCTALARVEGWKTGAVDKRALRCALRKTRRRARKRMRTALADGSGDTWHDWRKAVKTHAFHSALLRSKNQACGQTRRRALRRLGELLGKEHDLEILRDWLLEHTPETSVCPLLGPLDARRKRVRNKAGRLGRELLRN